MAVDEGSGIKDGFGAGEVVEGAHLAGYSAGGNRKWLEIEGVDVSMLESLFLDIYQP